MAVFDYTYQTWTGARRGPMWRWLAIPKFAFMEFFSRRIFIWLLTVASLQFVLRLGYVYVLANVDLLKSYGFQNLPLVEVDAFFFKSMIDMQLPFCFALTFVMGGGLISRDLSHRAIVLFMSKPVSLWEYIAGKFSVLFGTIMLVTWAQAMPLFVIQVMISPPESAWRTRFWGEYAWIAPAITFYSIVIGVSLSLTMMAASSLTRNARYAGTTFAVYIIGSAIIAGIMSDIWRSRTPFVISPLQAGTELGMHLFHLSAPRALGLPLAWSGLMFNWMLSAGILKWNLDRASRGGA